MESEIKMGVKSEFKQQNQFVTNNHNQSNCNQLNVWSKIEIKPEDIIDISIFAGYKKICIPVRCGHKYSEVCTFSHRENLDDNYDHLYYSGLKELIECKKYILSEKNRDDVGSAYTVASLIEDGDYQKFIKSLDKINISNGFEHVIQIKEEKIQYHILPVEDELAFGNTEQMGLIRFSIFIAFKDNSLIATKENINKAASEWISSNNKLNTKKFRQIIRECRVNKISDMPRVFTNCAIYINLFEKIKTEFQLQQLFEKISSEKTE